MSTNMRIWDRVDKTDTRYTKPAEVGGQKITSLSGTAMIMKATEIFGPVGLGFGWSVLEERFDKGFEMFSGEGDKRFSLGHELNHTMKIKFWFDLDGKRGELEQYGCTRYLYKSMYGTTTDGEAPKKSLSMLGFSADVFLGMFDDDEYVNHLKDEQRLERAEDKPAEERRQKQEQHDYFNSVIETMQGAQSLQELKKLHDHAVRRLTMRKDDTAVKRIAKEFKKLKKGVSNRTVNISIERVVRVLSLCARKWRDDERRPWLDSVPMLTKLEEKKSSRKPYPMSWQEQSILFAELPAHLQTMALFKVNTGTREQEVCKLRWDWEISVPELGTSVFLIPADFGGRHERSGVKNGDERLVVLNNVAKSIIDKQRGLSKEWVFPYNGNAMHRMNDSAWKKARVRAAKLWQEENLRPAHPGYASIRIHDLKHTFGRRLRAAGVTEEDRKALLGHKNGSITSHYSGAELGHLIEAANMVSATDSRGPVLTILKRKQA